MVLLHSATKPQQRTAPNFNLPGVDENRYTLDYYNEKKGIAVIFTCNHCPFAIASRPTIIELQQTYQDIGFFCISSNDAAYVPADGYTQMQALSKELNLGFPYLYDEDQSTAKAYDAQCTPDNYLFKKNGESFELFFHGRFNDNRQDPASISEKNFEEHINKLLHNQEADTVQPPSMGCSIKRKS